MPGFVAALIAAVLGWAAPASAVDQPLRGGSMPHEAQRPDPGADEAQAPLDEDAAEELSSQEGLDPGKLHLISAADLLNRPLAARDGDPAGMVRAMLIDAEDGQARFAIVDRARGKGLTAIPWRSLSVPAERGQPIMAMSTAERVIAAPDIIEQRLGDLTEPRVITDFTEYFRPPGGPEDERSQPIGAPAGYLMVTPDRIDAVIAPGTTPSGEAAPVTVATADGAAIGRIEQVMLDAGRGRISYLVVARGGQSWVPLPFEPLQWQPDARRFVLDTTDAQLAQLPTMGQNDVTQGLDEQSVAEIYDQFGVEPYWQ